MFKRMSALIQNALNKRTEQIHLPEPVSRQEFLHNQDDLELIQKLKSEISAIEHLHGCEFVKRERYFAKRRLLTIAKHHLKSAEYLSNDEWITESKSLVRYFSSSNENDADKAIAVLIPYADKYREMRTPKTTLRPKPHGRTMGANREMTTTTGSGNL